MSEWIESLADGLLKILAKFERWYYKHLHRPTAKREIEKGFREINQIK